MINTLEENKALVKRFFVAIENNRLQEFDEIVSEDYIDHLEGQKSGRENLKKYFANLHHIFTDLKFIIGEIVAEGNKVAVYNRIKGTHQNDYASFKAKGNKVDVQAFQLYRIENGQLTEHWEVADFMRLVQQIQA